MKYGVREICNVTMRAVAPMRLGNKMFYKDEPVLYFDSLKTSSMEGASTTVYAQGGRGNVRLVAWEGDRTVTFTMEDALATVETLALLTGSEIDQGEKLIHCHKAVNIELTKNGNTDIGATVTKIEDTFTINLDKLSDILGSQTPYISADDFTNFYVTVVGEEEPFILTEIKTNNKVTGYKIEKVANKYSFTIPVIDHKVTITDLDYYYKANCSTIEISADIHNYNYYLEAETLFRDAATGLDYPANFIVPNCRLQPNFTLTMANSGDPSTFTFTIDAFPGYIKGGSGTNKVLAAIEILNEPEVDVNLTDVRTSTPES